METYIAELKNLALEAQKIADTFHIQRDESCPCGKDDHGDEIIDKYLHATRPGAILELCKVLQAFDWTTAELNRVVTVAHCAASHAAAGDAKTAHEELLKTGSQITPIPEELCAGSPATERRDFCGRSSEDLPSD